MADWGERAAALIDKLSACSEAGAGVTRLPFTEQHRAALDVLESAMHGAGLNVSLDAAGTLIGRYDGPPGGKTLLLGSHQDSVREGGAYDGILGVVLSILALEKLTRAGVKLPFSVEVLAFADEEGVRFPSALIGPRALAGTLDPSVLAMRDAQGIELREAMIAFGLDPHAITALQRDPADLIGYIEPHIEQGPVLERAGQPAGVVTAICGIERHRIIVEGETGHAGTLPMAGRRDALVGAAAIIAEVDRMARERADLRATVGELSIEPNVVNAVPRRVELRAELRSPSDASRESAGETLHRFCQTLAEQQNLVITAERAYCQQAQPCDPVLSARLENALKNAGLSGLSLPSGATHDASAMADLCPIAMLFIRCRDGISHRPDESVLTEDMGLAVDILADVLRAF